MRAREKDLVRLFRPVPIAKPILPSSQQAPSAWHRSASVTAPPFWHPYVHIFSSKKVLLPTRTCLTQAGTSLSNTFSKVRGGGRVGGGEDRDGGRAVGQARQRGLETLQGCPAGRGVGWPEGGFNTLGALGGWSILCQFASSITSSANRQKDRKTERKKERMTERPKDREELL